MYCCTIIVSLLLLVSQVKCQRFPLPSNAVPRITSLNNNLTNLNRVFKEKFKSHYSDAVTNFRTQLLNLSSVANVKQRLRDLRSDANGDCLEQFEDGIRSFSQSAINRKLSLEHENITNIQETFANAVAAANHYLAKLTHHSNMCGSKDPQECTTYANYESKLQGLALTIKNLHAAMEHFDEVNFAVPINDELITQFESAVVHPVEDCIKSKGEESNDIPQNVEEEDPACQY